MKSPLHILHLEDNAYDAEFVKATLEAEGIHCEVTRAQGRADFVAALEKGGFDLVFSDIALPGYYGMAALEIVRTKYPDLPFIVISGTIGEDVAIHSLKSGATDYVLKQRLFRLVPAVHRAMKEVQERDERRSLQEQLLRAQRMESIGALASGIAHDLNNALVPIRIGSQLLQQTPMEEPERLKVLEMICTSAQRCSEMVRHILTFARGSGGQVGVLRVKPLLEEMAKIAADTFPKSVSVHHRVAPDLANITGDATELHQVLMNLCVNARDAMPEGGRLTLLAENIPVSPETARLHPGATAGPHIVISVADTGTGMPPEVRARIFEPFFTTKTPEKGTGLGMSTVADIVKRYHGFIEVRSELGAGTEFRIFLPATNVASAGAAPLGTTPLPVGHGELILIVDDEKSVLELAKTALEGHGYRVVTASNGLEAITCYQTNRRDIRLLVTDTDMPFLNGLNMIRSIQKLDAHLPIIMASGGQPNPEQLRLIDTRQLTTLNKPYDVEQLLTGVAQALKSGPKK